MTKGKNNTAGPAKAQGVREMLPSEFWAVQLQETLDDLASLGDDAGKTARWKLRGEARQLRKELDLAIAAESALESGGAEAELTDHELIEQLCHALISLPQGLAVQLRERMAELGHAHRMTPLPAVQDDTVYIDVIEERASG